MRLDGTPTVLIDDGYTLGRVFPYPVRNGSRTQPQTSPLKLAPNLLNRIGHPHSVAKNEMGTMTNLLIVKLSSTEPELGPDFKLAGRHSSRDEAHLNFLG